MYEWQGAQGLTPDQVNVIKRLQMPADPMAVARNTATQGAFDYLVPDYLKPKEVGNTSEAWAPNVEGKVPARQHGVGEVGLGAAMDMLPGGKAGGVAGKVAPDLAALILALRYGAPRGEAGQRMYRVLDDATMRNVGYMRTNYHPSSKHIDVEQLSSHLEPKYAGNTLPGAANYASWTFGPEDVRGLLAQVAKDQPDAKTIGGYRVSGARVHNPKEVVRPIPRELIDDSVPTPLPSVPPESRISSPASPTYYEDAGQLVPAFDPPQPPRGPRQNPSLAQATQQARMMLPYREGQPRLREIPNSPYLVDREQGRIYDTSVEHPSGGYSHVAQVNMTPPRVWWANQRHQMARTRDAAIRDNAEQMRLLREDLDRIMGRR